VKRAFVGGQIILISNIPVNQRLFICIIRLNHNYFTNLHSINGMSRRKQDKPQQKVGNDATDTEGWWGFDGS
jgi:hypothetical protein